MLYILFSEIFFICKEIIKRDLFSIHVERFVSYLGYRVFSRDVTAAMLVSLNKGTAAMLVSPTNPPGIELYYHANLFFCFGGKTSLPIT